MGLIKYIRIAAIERQGTNGMDFERLNPLIIENAKNAIKASIDAKKMVRNIWPELQRTKPKNIR